jgi:hypothetical protein
MGEATALFFPCSSPFLLLLPFFPFLSWSTCLYRELLVYKCIRTPLPFYLDFESSSSSGATAEREPSARLRCGTQEGKGIHVVMPEWRSSSPAAHLRTN